MLHYSITRLHLRMWSVRKKRASEFDVFVISKRQLEHAGSRTQDEQLDALMCYFRSRVGTLLGRPKLEPAGLAWWLCLKDPLGTIHISHGEPRRYSKNVLHRFLTRFVAFTMSDENMRIFMHFFQIWSRNRYRNLLTQASKIIPRL